MITLFKTLLSTLSEGLKTLTSFKEKQIETIVAKDKKSLDKAVNYAEKLIFHVEEHYDLSKDKTYQRLRRNFFKYN